MPTLKKWWCHFNNSLHNINLMHAEVFRKKKRLEPKFLIHKLRSLFWGRFKMMKMTTFSERMFSSLKKKYFRSIAFDRWSRSQFCECSKNFLCYDLNMFLQYSLLLISFVFFVGDLHGMGSSTHDSTEVAERVSFQKLRPSNEGSSGRLKSVE